MTIQKTTIVTFKTTPELKNRLKFLAKKIHKTSSFYINLLLNKHLDDLEDLYLSQQILEDIKNGKEKTYSADEVFKELN